MFKPAEMKKFSVVVLSGDTQAVLDEFHEEELAELRKADAAEKGLSSFEFWERERFASFQLTRTKRILGFFKANAEPLPLQGQARAFLFGEEAAKGKTGDFAAFSKETDSFLGELGEEIESLDARLKKIRERLSALREEKSILESIDELGIDLGLLSGYKSIAVVIGKIAPEFEDEFLALMQGEKQARLLKITGTAEKTVLFSAEAEIQDGLMRRLRKLGFDRIAVPESTGKPSALIKKTVKEISGLEAESRAVVSECRGIEKKYRKKVLVLQELLEIERSKGKAFQLFGRTEKTVVFEAFVPASLEGRFREKLAKAAKGRYHIEESAFKDEEAPVKLENRGFFKNYEFLLKLYGLPEYGSIDPTPFIAILYPIFFGIAFSDIGYGIIFLAIALFMRQTVGKKSETMRQMSNILVHGAIATIFFGWVFGGFFGDLGGESIKKIALIDPFGKAAGGQSYALLFIASMWLVGLLHLNLAILLGFREDLRKKNYKMALTDKLVYIFLEAGVALYAAGILFQNPPFVQFAGIAFLALALILMVAGAGLFGLMKITGFLGNVLSYSRLMVLSISTFAIAMSINILAGLLFAVPFIGFLLGALVLVLGHFANLLFNVLASFIHPLRLHFVEFFSFFYSGDGKEFRPFHVRRKLTEKKEVQENG
ncbi:MAG: V-type ATPase 116kDa subunit family protein [Candidatus Diapherotrites archaeon]